VKNRTKTRETTSNQRYFCMNTLYLPVFIELFRV
jgi:hypothetical protein